MLQSCKTYHASGKRIRQPPRGRNGRNVRCRLRQRPAKDPLGWHRPVQLARRPEIGAVLRFTRRIFEADAKKTGGVLMMPELTSWPAVLRRHVAERRRLFPVSETIISAPVSRETISPNDTISSRETISAVVGAPIVLEPRRGRPRKGEARETISAAEPWKAAGVSRATWYRRRG
jgi:hypothetical protein